MHFKGKIGIINVLKRRNLVNKGIKFANSTFTNKSVVGKKL